MQWLNLLSYHGVERENHNVKVAFIIRTTGLWKLYFHKLLTGIPNLRSLFEILTPFGSLSAYKIDCPQNLETLADTYLEKFKIL